MSKRNKKRPASRLEAQLSFRRISANTKHAHASASAARAQNPIASYSNLIALIKLNPIIRRAVCNPEYPRHYSQLEVIQPLEPIDLHRELRWAGAYLVSHAAKLERFVELSTLYQRSLLLDEHNNCEQLLASIEEELGVSLWLIKNKIAFLQASGGLDSQKRYLNEIVKDVGRGGTTPFIAYYASVRNEASVTPTGFASQYEQHLADLQLPADIDIYVRHHILPNVNLTRDQIGHVLRYEYAGSVVDYYETLVRMSQVVAGVGYKDLFPTIISTFKDIQGTIQDGRLTIPLAEMGGGHFLGQAITDCADLDCLNHFLRGNYEEALTTALGSVNRRADQFDLLEIAARSAALLPEQMRGVERPLAIRLVSKMRSVISKDSTVNADLTELVKVTLNHDSFPWSQALLAFARKETSPNPLGPDSELDHFAASTSPYLSPLRASAFPDEAARRQYSELTEECMGPSLAASYGRILALNELNGGPPEELVTEEWQLVKAETALRAGELEHALEAANALEASPHRYYKHKFIRLRAYCLLKLGQLDQCIRFVTSAYVAERNLHYILPVKDLVESIDEETRERFAGDISMPILYDMYSKYIGGKYDPQRKYASEDFLAVYDLQRPSAIGAILNNFPLDKLIYYLRHLCVESVMDNFTCFNYSWEVAEERLAVCRMLIKLDERNADSYQVEIRELLRLLMIQKRMREVEQSKIYVDIDSVRKAAEKSLRESFNRYMAFRRYMLDDTLSAVLDVLEKISAKTDQRLVLLTFPNQEMTRVLVSIIQELRDQYVSSKHGLDGYLSVRVRHGTLTNQLRNTLEAHHLVTRKKDTVTNEYTRNEYWIQRLAIADPTLQESLTGRLAQFSQDFDRLVKAILSEWIQVKKEPAGTGLFDFSVDEELVNTVAGAVDSETTFEQFLDIVFHIFGEVLNRNLEAVRARIETDAKTQFNELLTLLQTDIDKLLRYRFYPNTSDLNNAIRAARTDMQVTLDRIAAWFRLSKSTGNEPFDIEDAVNIGMESLRTSSQGFDAAITVEGKEKMVKIEGRQLTNFVDIFFTIFENVVRHSHTAAPPHVEVKISYDEGSVNFIIENEVGPGADTTASRHKLDTIKAAMQGERYVKSVTTEGGTGLHKIWKIIAHDFRNLSPRMDFGFRGGERFFVEFVVFTKGIKQ